MPPSLRQQDLLNEITHTGSLQEDLVTIPDSSKVMRVIRPASIDQLLDQAASDPEQQLPYWSELWPSGIALAALLRRQPELVHGKRSIELGCGLGITAAMALSVGAQLIATDYSSESLVLTRLTSYLYCDLEPETVRINWRETAHPLLDGTLTFPVVLAADVLYERRDIDPMLALLERILEPEGIVLLAEPGRNPARVFLDKAHELGWQSEHSSCFGPWPDPKDEGVVVRIHELRRKSAAATP